MYYFHSLWITQLANMFRVQ